ncbi:hypothetical protein KI387_036225, partial [Taxus chinensis]
MTVLALALAEAEAEVEVEEEEEEDGEMSRSRNKIIVVAVRVGASSHELLTWALVKAAQPADHVVALHVITNSELSSKEQSNTNYQAADFFNSAVEVYEGFCSLKQVGLQFKITHGSSVRKVLVEEAKLHEATKVILGASKHKALGSPISLAKYCVKKLPCSTSVLVVENGKVKFERDGAHHLPVANGPWLGFFNPVRWRIKIKNCEVLNNGVGNCLPVVECPLETTAVISGSTYASDENDNICDLVSDVGRFKISPVNMVNVCNYALSEKEASTRSLFSSRSRCVLCESNIETLVSNEKKYKRHDELKDSRSQSSCESLHTVSSASSLFSHGEEESGSCTTLDTNVSKELMSGSHKQKGVPPRGWPLLRRAISFSKPPSKQATARKMSVVEWAMRLPNRQARMTQQFQVKAEIAHEVYNQEYKVQSPNEGILIEASEDEAGFPCSQRIESRSEEHYLTKKLESLCESKTCRKFNYQELQSATSNFSAENFIGSGGWSRVYKGFLFDGQSVAVKVLNCSSEADEEFILEVEILTSLNHNRIISLVGYCVESHSRLLVYNFVSRGNLEENLHGGKNKPVLCWTERFKVAIGVAEALNYLHNGCLRSVIHRDVKSSNILLSENFEPQLADFGLAKWAPITSSHISCNDVLGTFGYLAPEYFIYGKVNDKTDIYAFGVVLLELITGRKPINTRYPKGHESLVMWAKPLLEEDSMGELVDKGLGDAYDTNEMQRMMLAAALCVTQASHYRPRISRIIKILRGEDDFTDWAWCQHTMTKDRDVSDEDEHIVNQQGHDIQTHLTLAMLG